MIGSFLRTNAGRHGSDQRHSSQTLPGLLQECASRPPRLSHHHFPFLFIRFTAVFEGFEANIACQYDPDSGRTVV
jgi:hypothetical protein